MTNNSYEQFLMEKELAQKLKITTQEDRKTAYKELYGHFFKKFPDVANKPQEKLAHTLQWQIELLKTFIKSDDVFMEIGAGNCLLSIQIAQYVDKVIAYEVADSIPIISNKPNNLFLKIFDGVDFIEDRNSISVIYSCQVFEHLHIEDTTHHIKQYYNMLKVGGKLVVITPNYLTGPHDISREYSKIPEGFHMKEYSYKELKKLLHEVGFRKIKILWGSKKLGYRSISPSIFILFENLYGFFPLSIRYKLKSNAFLKSLFGIKILCEKV